MNMDRRTFCLTLGAGIFGTLAMAGVSTGPTQNFRARKIFLPRWNDRFDNVEPFDALIVMPDPMLSDGRIDRIQTLAEKEGITLFRPVAGLPSNVDLSSPAWTLKSTAKTVETMHDRKSETDGLLTADGTVIVLFDASRCTWNVFARQKFAAEQDRLVTARLVDHLRQS